MKKNLAFLLRADSSPVNCVGISLNIDLKEDFGVDDMVKLVKNCVDGLGYPGGG